MKALRRWLLPGLVILAMAVAAFVALRPDPAPVDTALAARGGFLVTVDEDGRTRVRERYVVFTPLAGRLERIDLDAGDEITAGGTVLARIEPSDPTLLDARALAEAEARVRAAEARRERAQAERVAAVAAQEFAQTEFDRVRRAASGAAANAQELDDAELALVLRTQERHAAEFAEQIAAFELEQARAALVRTREPGAPEEWRFEIPAPINGRVLRVIRESAGYVGAGEPLLEVGDPRDLEFEIDVLSTDAVRVRPGARVIIDRWGGEAPLAGRVRVVEPSGFTKISALGVEEQRVNIIGDFEDAPDLRAPLGDAFRIEARIVVDEVADALVAPGGAFFRRGGEWAAFRVIDGRARLTAVRLGRRGEEQVEVLDGLAPGDEVILYPSDRVQDGARVRRRETPEVP